MNGTFLRKSLQDKIGKALSMMIAKKFCAAKYSVILNLFVFAVLDFLPFLPMNVLSQRVFLDLDCLEFPLTSIGIPFSK